MNQNGSGNVPGNAQNIPEAHVPRTYSSFDLLGHVFQTERFAEYTPIKAWEMYKQDNLPVRLAHNLLSYTMQSPLMQDITKTKELFLVPMECILPMNWEKFEVNPVRGDDVTSDVGPTIEDFWSKISTYMTALLTQYKAILNDNTSSLELVLQSTLRFLIIGELFYSNGSLMSVLNCHGDRYNKCTKNSKHISWDTLFDDVVYVIKTYVDEFTLHDFSNNIFYWVSTSDIPYTTYPNDRVPFRHALSLMRDDLTCYISSSSYVTPGTSDDLRQALLQIFDSQTSDYTFGFQSADIPFNTQFLSAYQLVCAHYMTNDHIDFVYSAELYRQLIRHYLKSGNAIQYFTRNGMQYEYDALSAKHLQHFISVASSNTTFYNSLLAVTNGTTQTYVTARSALGLLCAVFSFRRSLKYMDYFTGSRANPLAVGNTNVTVSGSTVSVIDITRNIQRQRFYNSVNRIVHSAAGYLKGIFGGDMPAPDYHNPFDLARTVDTVFGDQTNNTGSAQMSDDIAITTNLRANSNNYMFEVRPDRTCIAIALTYYDIPRVHLATTDRSFFHVDRFDYFNPFMQYTGDQPVYQQELGVQSTVETQLQNFGYQLKYGEFKQLYNTASGGFVENLPGFCFPAVDRRGSSGNINPEFIRSVQSEFDHFYNSLTGYSLATYFHFIVDNFVDFSGTRPMAFAPQILG